MLTEYTKIKNEILEALLSAGLSGVELSVVLFVIRKTYGWEKKSDRIPTSQFCKAIGASKSSVERAKSRLALVRILTLVSKGTPDGMASEWAFNKNISEWTLVPKMTVVLKMSKPSPKFAAKVVPKVTPSKDNTKDIQKKGKFIPPTIKEIKSYFDEKAVVDESEKFYYHYESNGWKVGKNSMKNWRASASGWISRSGIGKVDFKGMSKQECSKYIGSSEKVLTQMRIQNPTAYFQLTTN